MNRKLKLFTAVLALLLVTAFGCSSQEVGQRQSVPDVGEGVTYVLDALYTTQLKAFTWEPENYNGKKYAIDGIYGVFDGESYVYRYSPGTDEHGHTTTSLIGIELVDASGAGFAANDKDWIRVIGTLDAEAHGEHTHVSLIVESLEVLTERGNETVY